jgi:hypothetical protein
MDFAIDCVIYQFCFKKKSFQGDFRCKWSIPGANVFNKAINRSTQTDFNGKYSIIAKSGQVLEVSYMWA